MINQEFLLTEELAMLNKHPETTHLANSNVKIMFRSVSNFQRGACYDCAKKDPIAKITWDTLADTVKLKSEVKGYLPFVKASSLKKVPAAKYTTTLCHADVVKLYEEVLPFGGIGAVSIVGGQITLSGVANGI
jgi:hypothetical protein